MRHGLVNWGLFVCRHPMTAALIARPSFGNDRRCPAVSRQHDPHILPCGRVVAQLAWTDQQQQGIADNPQVLDICHSAKFAQSCTHCTEVRAHHVMDTCVRILALQAFQRVAPATSKSVKDRLPKPCDVVPKSSPSESEPPQLCHLAATTRRVRPLRLGRPSLHETPKRRHTKSVHIEAALILLPERWITPQVVSSILEHEPRGGWPIVAVAADVVRQQLCLPLGRIDR
mmetsp:Transcript_11374/g.28685  ORF Transcript_11374/g.28685 Transcript_11374/m.28685 type:complete len:229 (-) Transcript_11374:727-1413(-)